MLVGFVFYSIGSIALLVAVVGVGVGAIVEVVAEAEIVVVVGVGEGLIAEVVAKEVAVVVLVIENLT